MIKGFYQLVFKETRISPDIVKNFEIRENKGQKKYYIPGKIILEEKYLVKDSRCTLDSIEQSLKETDFLKNRDHYKWTLTRSNIDINDITSDFKISVDNNWGSIPEAILSMKEDANNTLQEIETVSSLLQNLIEEEDPIVISEYAEDIYYKCGTFPKPCITISDEIFSNEDLEKAVLNHKRVISELKSKNKLNEYMRNLNQIKESIENFLIDNTNLNSKSIHKCSIKISKENFIILNINNEFVDEIEESQIVGNELFYYWKPLGIHYGGKKIESVNDRILENCKYVCPKCMVEILKYCLDIHVYDV